MERKNWQHNPTSYLSVIFFSHCIRTRLLYPLILIISLPRHQGCNEGPDDKLTK